MAEVISQLALEQKRRQKLADALAGQAANQPVASHWQGLAKVLNSGLSSYNQVMADEAGKEYEKRRQEALQKALDPNTKKEDMGKILADGGYESEAIKLATETPKFDLSGQAEQALYKAAQGQPLTPQEAAAVKAYNDLKGMEQMVNPATGAMMPKYRQLNVGGQRVADAGAAGEPSMFDMPPEPTMQGPAGGLLPPPSGQGQPDMSVFNGNPKAEQKRVEILAEKTGELQAGAPVALQKAEGALKLIDDILKDNGLGESVGGPAGLIGRQAGVMPVSEGQRRVVPKIQQLQGKAFLEAFESLKGGGQITQIEGQKATDAIARLQTYQNEADYRRALGDLRDVVVMGAQRARQAAGLGEGQYQIDPALVGGTVVPAGGLTPEEAAEFEQLKRMFGE